MNIKQISKVVAKMVKWDELEYPVRDKEVLTIELDYPYYIEVKYGTVTMYEIISDKVEELLGEQRSKAIAVVDFDGKFDCYRPLHFGELVEMYDILNEYLVVKDMKE